MRKKTFIVMTILTVLYLILWTVLIFFYSESVSTYNEPIETQTIASIMLSQTSLQFSSMLLCLLTIMLGAGTIGSELENGIIHAVISRPIRRFEYVMGRFLGILILMSIYSTIMFFSILTIGSVFKLTTIISLSPANAALGWLLFILVPAMLLCLTVFGSVLFKVVPNGLLMIFIYILGNIGGMVEMIGKVLNSEGVINAGIFISLISPFHTLFSSSLRVLLPSTGILGEMMQSAGGLAGSGNPASIWMYLYMCVYAVGFVFLAVRRFNKIDIT